jgi:hypothetical protein
MGQRITSRAAFVAWLGLIASWAVPSGLYASGPDLRLAIFPEQVILNGRFDGQQLVVAADGTTLCDVTAEAHYQVLGSAVVRVSPDGYVQPLTDGAATILITAAGQVRSVPVVVQGIRTGRPLHFANDIVPLLTRHGCNAGACHGKASGQNGFKLSLFGFDPPADHAAIVKEARGRRIFPTAPERSLLLTKPSGQTAHSGGRRLPMDSTAYSLLREWIDQGAPAGDERAPSVQLLTIVPGGRILGRGARQQLAVLAASSDGSVRDVTRLAQYQSSEPAVATVTDTGLVQSLDLPGESVIMARYVGLVATFRATVPASSAPAEFADFRPANFIDVLAAARWRKLGLAPSAPCTDSEFIRRVTLDLCGKLPAPQDVRTFLADTRPDKRARLIDRCLEDKDYAAFFALRWGSILRNAPKVDASEPATYAFHEWLRDMLARNRPYDEFVRAILTATGEWQEAPAVNWLWQMSGDPIHQPAADTAQLFLGIRLQCARCHHHPFERWGQDDYFGLAGFFTRLGRKSFAGESGFYTERKRTVDEPNPRTGQPIEPKLLDGPVLNLAAGEDPRIKLVDWMVRPDNPYFARAFVNRMWGHLLGRGLVDPVDDLRETNPPTNPELLDALARDFVRAKFDIKHLLRTICNSETYQRSALPNERNRHDRQNHARYYARRLYAEVLLDAVDQVCGTHTEFNKMPKQARAVDLPHEGYDSYFLEVFDRPQRSSACECIRSNGASLTQVLHLVNSPEVEDKVAADTGRVARLVQANVPPDKIVEELYLAALARYPTSAEKQTALAHAQKLKELRRGLEDVLWSLLNTREFLFNH